LDNTLVIPSLEFQFTDSVISANSCEVLGEKNQYLKEDIIQDC